MDYNQLADLLFPQITKTPANYEADYPPRDLPEEMCIRDRTDTM